MHEKTKFLLFSKSIQLAHTHCIHICIYKHTTYAVCAALSFNNTFWLVFFLFIFKFIMYNIRARDFSYVHHDVYILYLYINT